MDVERDSRVVVKILKPKAEAEKPKSQEAALLDALRGFVRHEASHPEKKTAEEGIRPLQVVVLLVLVLDTVLLYWEFQALFENAVVQFGLKVGPWLLGATAFTYSDKARGWLLAQCRQRWLGITAGLLLLPLVIPRLPLFSVKVRTDSDSVSVGSADGGNSVPSPQEARLFVVTFPDLAKPYTISVKDGQGDKVSEPFSLRLGRLRIARATFARIPILGRLFGDAEIPLTPLYRVPTTSAQAAYATVEGEFQEGFLQPAWLSGLSCNEVKAANPKKHAVRCSVLGGGDALRLPPGLYKFTLFRDVCKKELPVRPVKEGQNEAIDFDQICSK